MALKDMLENLHYTVIDSVMTGEDAIKKAEQLDIDIILMDIHLKGSIDGIQTAQEIRNKKLIPIIFITAYADEETINRAKLSEPYAYIIKPFNELSLRSNIEISLYKHKLELDLKDKQKHLEDVINSISDILFSIDANNHLKIWNRKAQQLFGFHQKDIIQRPIDKLPIFYDDSFNNLINCIRSGKEIPKNLTIKMKTREGSFRLIRVKSKPIILRNTGHREEIIIIGKDVTYELCQMKKFQEGRSYLWYNQDLDTIYSTFINLQRFDFSGLFISRFITSEMEKIITDENIAHYILNKYNDENLLTISTLEDFKKIIIDFCKRQPAIILIERLDFFFIYYSFDQVMQVLFEINDIVHSTKSILFLVIKPDIFDKKQFSLIHNEFFSIPKQYDDSFTVPEEFFKILAFLSEEHRRQRTVSLKILKEEFDATYPTISKKIHELEEKHLIRVVKKGRLKTIEITSEGEKILIK